MGNLSFDVTRDELIEAFSAAGKVVDAKVPTDRETGRPRGFAFVEFESDEAAQKAVALDPLNPAPHLTLADIFRRQRRFADAETELEKAIQLAPKASDPYLALAQQHIEQRQLDKAEEERKQQRRQHFRE